MKVSEQDRERALAAMKPGREYTTGDLVTLAGLDKQMASAALKSLRQTGQLNSDRTHGGDRTTLYRLA